MRLGKTPHVASRVVSLRGVSGYLVQRRNVGRVWGGLAAIAACRLCVLSRRTRSKIRVAKGIRPARMMATQSGSILPHATL